MGAWNFVHGRLHKLLRDTHTLRHVSRAESASPAIGQRRPAPAGAGRPADPSRRLTGGRRLGRPVADPRVGSRASDQKVVGQGDPHLGGEAQGLDVDPLVDAVEHGPVLLEADGVLCRPNP